MSCRASRSSEPWYVQLSPCRRREALADPSPRQIPTAGSFPHWASRFIDPSVGFSLALSYGYCYTIAVRPLRRRCRRPPHRLTFLLALQIASEVSAAAVLVSYWSDISPAVVISISLALILAINLMPVRFYGETEVVTACVKILCFLMLVVVSIVITAGGAPEGNAIGFRYWNNPGAWVDYNGASSRSDPLFPPSLSFALSPRTPFARALVLTPCTSQASRARPATSAASSPPSSTPRSASSVSRRWSSCVPLPLHHLVRSSCSCMSSSCAGCWRGREPAPLDSEGGQACHGPHRLLLCVAAPFPLALALECSR